jgi:hypothetical protein
MKHSKDTHDVIPKQNVANLRRTLSRFVRVSHFYFWLALLTCPAGFTQDQFRSADSPQHPDSLSSVAQDKNTDREQTEPKDDPSRRAAWFLKGRFTPSVGLAGPPASPARNLLRSFRQLQQMNLSAKSRPAARSGPGLAAPAVPTWDSLGPAPQKSKYWRDVSGRVTALAIDLQHDSTGSRVYVGTAFGGVWMRDSTANPASDPNLDSKPRYIALSDNWPSLSIGSIAVDGSVNPPVLYVGTGEANNSLDSYYGIGILRVTNEGAHWTLSTGDSNDPNSENGPFVGASVSKILVDPDDHTYLLAAISSAAGSQGKTPAIGIYESKNSGKTWNRFDLPPRAGETANYTSYNCTDLLYEPTQKTYYASITALGVYKYKRGAQWQALHSPFVSRTVSESNFKRVALATRNTGTDVTIFALMTASDDDLSRSTDGDTGVARSLDGGGSWTPVLNVPQYFLGTSRFQGFYDLYIAAPGGTEALILGGIDVWMTQSVKEPNFINLTNVYDYSGVVANPTKHVHADQHALVILNPTRWIIGNDGGVWRTNDAGNTWTDANGNLSSIQFTSVTPHRTNGETFIGGSQDNGTAVGNSQSPWMTTLSGDGGFTADNPRNNHEYFTERYDVSLYESHDDGQNWNIIADTNAVTNDSYSFYLPYQLVEGSPDRMLLGTRTVWLGYASPDADREWTAISPQLASPSDYIKAFAVSPKSANEVYVVTSDAKVWVNHNVLAPDAMHSWVRINNECLIQDPIRPFAAIRVDSNNKSLLIGVQGFGPGHVLQVNTDGSKCDDITPMAEYPDPDGSTTQKQLDTPVNSILVDQNSSKDIYIGTDIGVFVSSDGGKIWRQYGPNLPRSAVMELKMTQTNPRVLIAATHGRGAWSIAPLH